MTAAGWDVDDLADFVIAAEDSVNFSSLGIRREIDRELIEILLFPCRGNASGVGATFDAGRNGLSGFLVFRRTSDDVPEVLMKRFGTDF